MNRESVIKRLLKCDYHEYRGLLDIYTNTNYYHQFEPLVEPLEWSKMPARCLFIEQMADWVMSETDDLERFLDKKRNYSLSWV